MPIEFNSSSLKHSVLRDPAFIRLLPRVIQPDKDYLRAELDVPVCPVEELSDSVLYEDPQNAASKYYLPRYKLATERTVSGKEQYRIAIRERAPGWSFSILLDKYPAKEIELAVREAKELPHQVQAVLRYVLIDSGGVQKELVFGDMIPGEHGLQVIVQLGSLAERDELYVALTESKAKATLMIRRTVHAAIPIPSLQNEDTIKPVITPQSIPTRPKRAIHPQLLSNLTKQTSTSLNIDRTIKSFSDKISAIEKAELKFDLPILIQQSKYRKVDRVLDDAIPLFFPADLHSYIFGEIAAISDRPGLIRHQVRQGGKFHSYYQETSRPYLFYYLPDAFKLARLPEPSYMPYMSVRFDSDDGSLDASRATLDYAAVPVIDIDRIEAAAQELKAHVTGTLPVGVEGPEFQPLLADTDRLSFRLSLPGTAGPFQIRNGALVNLKEGIVDSITLSLQELQAVFETLMGSGGAAPFMTGEVEVRLDDKGSQIAEKVPFTARMDDLAGEVVEYNYSQDPQSGEVQVSLRNRIESPIRIDRLGVELYRDGRKAACELRGLTFPVERLASGEELSFTVVPIEAQTGEGRAEILVDSGGIKVMPDREAIWNAILDPFTSQYRQEITVKTLPAIFNLPQDKPEEERLSEIIVELRRGEDSSVTVSLQPDHLETKVTLPFPIADILLRRENSGEYQYQVTAIRLSGEMRKEWKSKAGDLLYIFLGDVT